MLLTLLFLNLQSFQRTYKDDSIVIIYAFNIPNNSLVVLAECKGNHLFLINNPFLINIFRFFLVSKANQPLSFCECKDT